MRPDEIREMTLDDIAVRIRELEEERFRLQFRTEIFNATNTPYFGSPGAVGLTIGTATFGKITSAGDPRIIQFGLKFLF